jgi:hypothetical protein
MNLLRRNYSEWCGISPLIYQPLQELEMSVHFHAPAALFPEKTHVIPITHEVGWAQEGEGVY